MPNINITVAEKIATNTTPGEVIVCGNSGYNIAFTFDSEWDAETQRTARFVYYKDGLSLYQDVDFTGNTVEVPPLYGVDYVLVGVYTDNLRTTTPARVNCDRSILCGDPLEVPTPEQTAKLQAQIGDLSQLSTEAKANLVAAINEAAKLGAQNGHLVTVSVRRDYTTEQYVADKSYAELKAAKGEGKQIFAFYGNSVFFAGAYEPGCIRFYELQTPNYTYYGQFTLSSAGWEYEEVETPGGAAEIQPLTFTGAAEATYDGSRAVEVMIPQGGGATDEQIASVVEAYLGEHPEATTTVADKSITPMKTDFIEHQSSEVIDTTFSSTGYKKFGTDFIDISELNCVYVRVVDTVVPAFWYVTFYDSSKKVIGATEEWSDEKRHAQFDEDTSVWTSVYELDTSAAKAQGAVYVKTDFQSMNDSVNITVHRTKRSAFNERDALKFTEKYGVVDIHLPGFKNTGAIEYRNPNLIEPGNFESVHTNHPHGFANYSAPWHSYIDTTDNKSLYVRTVCTTTPSAMYSPIAVACYDGEKNFLYNEKTTQPANLTAAFMRGKSNVQLWDGNTYSMVVWKVTVPDQVAYVRIQATGTYCKQQHLKYGMVSYADIYDLGANPETYEMVVTDEFKKAVQACEYGVKTYTMVMIGDSLTNWGGGNDSADGFLKVVHDKTGVRTTNEGMAGAWWQLMDGETIDGTSTNGVGRVNAIISSQRKYDLYCFMLGTNAGSNTDTGENSENASTMSGAIRYCMEKLKAYDPTAQILVCLPPQRAEGNESQEKVNAVIKSIVESYGVRTLDIYHNGGIVPNTKIANVGYLSDGLHLGENGIQVLGKALAAEVKYLLCL